MPPSLTAILAKCKLSPWGREIWEQNTWCSFYSRNCLPCVECQGEPCCATAPTCLGKIEITRCLTLWMISQLLTCPICSSQLSLICFSLCVCSGTNKTAASLQAPLLWNGAKALRFSLLQEKKSTKKIRFLPRSVVSPILQQNHKQLSCSNAELWNNIPPTKQTTLQSQIRRPQNTTKHRNATSQPQFYFISFPNQLRN